ncbi:MAG: hypothetical protein ACK5U7_14475, partial [Bacteroidota bacterium]
PIATIVVAYFVSTNLSSWKQQKIIEKRLEFFDKHFPDINVIYAYCKRVGRYSFDHSPEELIEKKREADAAIHRWRVIFSEDFFQAYQGFIQECYDEHTGHATNAKLKLSFSKFKGMYKSDWDDNWDSAYFTTEDSNLSEKGLEAKEGTITEKYEHFLQIFQTELGLKPIKTDSCNK